MKEYRKTNVSKGIHSCIKFTAMYLDTTDKDVVDLAITDLMKKLGILEDWMKLEAKK